MHNYGKTLNNMGLMIHSLKIQVTVCDMKIMRSRTRTREAFQTEVTLKEEETLMASQGLPIPSRTVIA